MQEGVISFIYTRNQSANRIFQSQKPITETFQRIILEPAYRQRYEYLQSDYLPLVLVTHHCYLHIIGDIQSKTSKNDFTQQQYK